MSAGLVFADVLGGMAHMCAGDFTELQWLFASLVTIWAVILLFLPLSPQFGDGSEALSSVT